MPEESRPLVSIIIPCYNAAPWVAEAIETCLNQTYQPIEIIVVDDGSTDNSLSIIHSFGDRIKWVSGPNHGGCHARNRGFGLSRGKYVMFLDADDKIAPENVALLVQALDGKLDHMAACEWRYLSKQGNRWKEFKPLRLPRHLDDIQRELYGAHTPLGAWLQPRDIVTRIGGWDEALTAYQDVDFRLRCLLSGAKFIRIRGGRFYYRLHEFPSVSKTVSESALRSRLRVVEKTQETMRQKGVLAF